MKLQAKKRTDFLQTPTGPKLGILFPNQPVESTGKTQDLFSEIDPGGLVGWALTADLEASDEERVPLVPEIFVQQSIVVERSFNNLPATVPWFIAADFLIARAIIETGLINSGPKSTTSDAVGPLQVSSGEWKSFLKDGGDLAKPFKPFNPSDFDNYVSQIWAAGHSMLADAKEISRLKSVPPVASESDPFLPSYLSVFHAYLLGPAPAVKILDENETAAGRDRPLDTVLVPPLLKAVQLKTLFSTRSDLVGTEAAPKTVAEFVAATDGALGSALAKAFELIRQFAPGELPQGGGAPGSAPWLAIAKAIKSRNVAEPGDNPEIKKYFLSTDHGAVGGGGVPAWCGAFVAHCLAKSENATAAASIPKVSARAVSWRKWGKAIAVGLKDIPEGAVVVLSPQPGTTGSSGHVGFHSKFIDANTIELLGGNQHRGVNLSPFKVSTIVDIRWLNVAPTPSGGGSSVLDQIADPDDHLALARTIFGEARGESNAGREAVAHVVINRVNSHKFRDTIEGVCLQPSQFSCFNVGDPNRPKILALDQDSENPTFKDCLAVARRVIDGAVADNTGGATHYYARTIAAPSWTIGATLTAEIGVHRFFKNVR
ncbi:cell wall hydrolase [Bradyrhizobium sp. JYMT SZCCT0180]|uniref:cell wall hydrolase n=1 Tax=Bradyrhizobium sp. JYMT SZCCT0180 TaxID=2807666 RepID=UPI001BA4C32F|nr:cell wall hydrolase [Bradyrhizobium sp. JYMT SZCCT0180]MBR1209307.1 cell wall hydrolase [Bradyrhizobium sp. JYMT SZCCT0180]